MNVISSKNRVGRSAFLFLAVLAALPLQAAKPGLFVSSLQGKSMMTPLHGASFALTPGKLLGKGAVLDVPAGSMVKLMLAEHVDVGLAGPARLAVRELRRLAGKKPSWQ